jgi:hypothetical protein
MNETLAMEFVKRRMNELGFGENYISDIKHLVLLPNEKREVSAFNEFYYLLRDTENIRIRSDFGFYDLSFAHTNAQSYEHHGQIFLENTSPLRNHLRFLHILPKH